MRIRKGRVQFPLSSLTPHPLSDPPFLPRSSAVQLHVHGSFSSDHPPHPSSDQQIPHVSDLLSITIARQQPNAKQNQPSELQQLEAAAAAAAQDKHRRAGGERNPNDSGKGSVVGAETSSGVLPSFLEAGGERAVPFKKRKVSLLAEDATTTENTREKMKAARNSNTNTKTEDEDRKEDVEYDNKEKKTKKKRGGGAVMEGSRCSRMNGRGWRCCQQTLVGYSLCEHHLGKGRLRTIPTVLAAATSTAVVGAPINDDKKQQQKRDDNDDCYDEKPMMMTTSKKRRVRIGTVKARSLSSLLSEPHNNNSNKNNSAASDDTSFVAKGT